MNRVIFHIDMDAFFASIEQRDFPEYRGKPLVVGAPPNQRGVVCAASYEARKFQVRSAMPSRTAAKLCPHAIFVQPRMDVYRAESKAIMSLIEAYTPVVETVSIDEAYLDLSHRSQGPTDIDDALRASVGLARELKEKISKERYLTASIGIASNKFLAKLGSDFQKPDGLTLITEAEKIAFLRPLSIRSIHGVGPVTAQSLETHGLITIGDIQDSSLSLAKMVGSWAEQLRARAFGNDERPVDPVRERKSISAENTFLLDTDDRPTLRRALMEMATDIAATLEETDQGALTVQVKVRYKDFTTLTRQIRVEEPVTSARQIYRLSCHLLATHALVSGPLRLIGIGLSTLVPRVSPQLLLPLG